jgi:hypothetical protein
MMKRTQLEYQQFHETQDIDHIHRRVRVRVRVSIATTIRVFRISKESYQVARSIDINDLSEDKSYKPYHKTLFCRVSIATTIICWYFTVCR